jgi:hypothetical protein
MPIGTTLLFNVLSTVVIIFINAFSLWLSIDTILKYSRAGFKTAMKAAFVAGVISFLLGLIPTFTPALVANPALTLLFFVINAGVMLYLIKRFYELDWKEASVSWLLVLVLSFVIGFVVGNFIGLVTPLFA